MSQRSLRPGALSIALDAIKEPLYSKGVLRVLLGVMVILLPLNALSLLFQQHYPKVFLPIFIIATVNMLLFCLVPAAWIRHLMGQGTFNSIRDIFQKKGNGLRYIAASFIVFCITLFLISIVSFLGFFILSFLNISLAKAIFSGDSKILFYVVLGIYFLTRFMFESRFLFFTLHPALGKFISLPKAYRETKGLWLFIVKAFLWAMLFLAAPSCVLVFIIFYEIPQVSASFYLMLLSRLIYDLIALYLYIVSAGIMVKLYQCRGLEREQ